MPKRAARKAPAHMPKELGFDFIKSNFFRVISTAGAFGGIAPNGSIHMAVYSERQALPTKIVHTVIGNQLGPEIMSKRQSRNAIVREVEADLVFDLNQAIAMRQWLDEKIASLNAIQQTMAGRPSDPVSAPKKLPSKRVSNAIRKSKKRK